MEDLVAAELGALRTLVGGTALSADAQSRALAQLGRLAALYREFHATYQEPTRQELLRCEQATLRLLAPDRVAAVATQERFESLHERLGIRGADRRAA